MVSCCKDNAGARAGKAHLAQQLRQHILGHRRRRRHIKDITTDNDGIDLALRRHLNNMAYGGPLVVAAVKAVELGAQVPVGSVENAHNDWFYGPLETLRTLTTLSTLRALQI